MNKYKLTKITYEKLNELNDKIKLAKILNAILVVAPFVEIFTSKPDISVVWQVSNTEWELFGQTVGKMRDLEKNIFQKFCFTEEAYHARKNNLDDMRFWKGMKESFIN